MSPGNKSSRDTASDEEQNAFMASRKEAVGAVWEGADLDRPIKGEDPETDSLEEARRWVSVYSHLVKLEQELLDLMASMIPAMPDEARREAELTNLPVLASQVERFRHRLDYWTKRKEALTIH